MDEEGKGREWAITRIEIKKAEIALFAASLFTPAPEDPYFLNRGTKTISIKDLTDLKENLDLFTVEESLWLASWIEYLGDNETADRIRAMPEKFKEIIAMRHDELRDF